MTHERLRELLTACPELTRAELDRLRGYQPKISLMWMSVQLALRAWR